MLDAYDFIVEQRNKGVKDRDISKKLGLAEFSFGLSGNRSIIKSDELKSLKSRQYELKEDQLRNPFLIEILDSYELGVIISDFNPIYIEHRRTKELSRPDMAYLFNEDLISSERGVYTHRGRLNFNMVSLKETLKSLSRCRKIAKSNKELQMLAIRSGFKLIADPLRREVETMPDVACYSVVHPGLNYYHDEPCLNFHKIEIKEDDSNEPNEPIQNYLALEKENEAKSGELKKIIEDTPYYPKPNKNLERSL